MGEWDACQALPQADYMIVVMGLGRDRLYDTETVCANKAGAPNR